MNSVANCPECREGWTLVELVTWVQELTMSYDASAKCPKCGIETIWTNEGEIGIKREVQVVQVEVFPNRRREGELILCACGCGKTFTTTHHDKYYLNNAHRTAGKRKGIVVDTGKRNVRSRERTKGV